MSLLIFLTMLQAKEQGNVHSDNKNTSDFFSERLQPQVYDVTQDWVDTSTHTMEAQVKTSSCSRCIYPDSDLHQRPPTRSKA